MNLKHCKKQPGRGSEVQNRNTTERGSESEIRWGVSFVKRGSDVIAKSKLWNGEKQTWGQADSVHASGAREGACGGENQRTPPCRAKEGPEPQDGEGGLKNGPML